MDKDKRITIKDIERMYGVRVLGSHVASGDIIDETGTRYSCEDGRVIYQPPLAKENKPVAEEAQPELPGVESTLAERAKRYGDFAASANATQKIKRILFEDAESSATVPAVCRQAAEMIVTKLVRAMYGEPEFIDNWHDIAGYATLVEKHLANDFTWKA